MVDGCLLWKILKSQATAGLHMRLDRRAMQAVQRMFTADRIDFMTREST